MAEQDDQKNPVQQLVGGILGLPGKILKETGLDALGTTLVDSIQPDGTLSVSHLLDLGGVRSAKTRRREIEGKMGELSLEASELEIEQAKRKAMLDQISQAMGMQDLAPSKQQQVAKIGGDIAAQRAGAPAAKEALATGPTGPGINQKQQAIQAGIAAGEQARQSFLKTQGLDAESMAASAQARAALNERLRARGVKNPEGLTNELELGKLQDLEVDLIKDRINERQLKRRQAARAQDSLKLAKFRAANRVGTTNRPTVSFERGVADDLELGLGIKGQVTDPEKGTTKTTQVRPATKAELAAVNQGKAIAREVFTATGDPAVANAAAAVHTNMMLGRPRFGVMPSNKSFDFKKGDKGWFRDGPGPVKAGTKKADVPPGGLTDQAIEGILDSIYAHRLQNDALSRSGLKLADGRPLGIDPDSPDYVAEWHKSLSEIPGLVVRLVPDPQIPGQVILDFDTRESAIPEEQIKMIRAALVGR